VGVVLRRPGPGGGLVEFAWRDRAGGGRAILRRAPWPGQEVASAAGRASGGANLDGRSPSPAGGKLAAQAVAVAGTTLSGAPRRRSAGSPWNRRAGVVGGAVAVAAAAAVSGAAMAAGDAFYQFQSPSGNIDCGVGTLNGASFAGCEIRDHTWVAPPRPAVCEGGWGDRIELDPGSVPALVCHTDTLRGSGLPTLGYGDSRSAGPITCTSQPSGITCTDAGTGHSFRIARDSYELH
jgi:hypothetical protein